MAKNTVSASPRTTKPRDVWTDPNLQFEVEDHWVRVSKADGELVGHISPVVRGPFDVDLDLREPGTSRIAWSAMARVWMHRLEHETARSRRPSKWTQ